MVLFVIYDDRQSGAAPVKEAGLPCSIARHYLLDCALKDRFMEYVMSLFENGMKIKLDIVELFMLITVNQFVMQTSINNKSVYGGCQ